MTGENGEVRKILIFFIPFDMTVALEVLVEPFTVRPKIAVVLGERLAELEEDQMCRVFQRKHEENPKQLAARVFGLKPNQVFEHPIAYPLFQEITERTKDIAVVGRNK